MANFGTVKKGRVPNPAGATAGALTLLINPADPPKKGDKSSKHRLYSRSRSRFDSARGAWADIGARTGYTPKDVLKPDHTSTHWRWWVKVKPDSTPTTKPKTPKKAGSKRPSAGTKRPTTRKGNAMEHVVRRSKKRWPNAIKAWANATKGKDYSAEDLVEKRHTKTEWVWVFKTGGRKKKGKSKKRKGNPRSSSSSSRGGGGGGGKRKSNTGSSSSSRGGGGGGGTKRKKNPDEIIIPKKLEKIPEAFPGFIAGFVGWLMPGLVSALIGEGGRAALAKGLGNSPANAQAVVTLGTNIGWFFLSDMWDFTKKWRRPTLYGMGLRLGFDGFNALLPKGKGTWASNFRAFVGLPGGDMKLQLPGMAGVTTPPPNILVVQKFADNTGFKDAKDEYFKADVVIRGGKFYDKTSRKLLAKDAAGTPWTTADFPGGVLAGMGHGYPLHPMYTQQNLNGWQNFQPVLNGWQNFQPYIPNTMGGWQNFQPQIPARAGAQNGTMGEPWLYTTVYNLQPGQRPMGQSPARGPQPPSVLVGYGGSMGHVPRDYQAYEI